MTDDELRKEGKVRKDEDRKHGVKKKYSKNMCIENEKKSDMTNTSVVYI